MFRDSNISGQGGGKAEIFNSERLEDKLEKK